MAIWGRSADLLGGVLETKKIASIAEVFNAQIAPHLYAGPIEWAANIQLATNIPNLLIAETILTGGDFHMQLINNSISWSDGYIITPDKPGLGIDFNEKIAFNSPYKEKSLHLEMQENLPDYKRKIIS